MNWEWLQRVLCELFCGEIKERLQRWLHEPICVSRVLIFGGPIYLTASAAD